jgi:hypothetical protein
MTPGGIHVEQTMPQVQMRLAMRQSCTAWRTACSAPLHITGSFAIRHRWNVVHDSAHQAWRCFISAMQASCAWPRVTAPAAE